MAASVGIGFAVVELLVKRAPQDHILLGVRDLDRGKAAVKKLQDGGIKSRLDLVEIDITSDASIRAAEQDIRTRFGRLDSSHSPINVGSWMTCMLTLEKSSLTTQRLRG